MMDGMNHGWGMGFGWGWIIGIAILVVIIWVIVKGIIQKTNPKSIK
jgi:putative membrane protein